MVATIIKYVIIAIIFAYLLNSLPYGKPTTQTIMCSVLGLFVVMYVLDCIFDKREGMHYDSNYKYPNQYLYDSPDEDYLQTGLKYDYDLPGYYLINNGTFSNKGISFDNVDKLIAASKYHDLVEQDNHVVASPHTHIGKERGHLNWEKML